MPKAVADNDTAAKDKAVITQDKDPINGVWTNSYGSIMRLQAEGGAITGYYSSTTGSTGVYKIVGFYDPEPTSKSRGTTVALAIAWRSYVGGEGGTGSHWTSTMSGKYFVDKDQEKMELINALSTSSVHEGENAEEGLYPESLTFKRYYDQSWETTKPPVKEYSDVSPIIGTWGNELITLVIEKATKDGFVEGICSIAGDEFPFNGCYDYDLASPLPAPAGIRAVSLVISNRDSKGNNHHSQMALSGLLHEKEGRLDLYGFKTFSLTKYTSNRLSYISLVKQQDEGKKNAMEPEEAGTLVLPVYRGLAKNNGATPWYVEMAIGDCSGNTGRDDLQLFKFIFDTGTACTWVTSKECDTVPCKHHSRYDFSDSKTHKWIDREEKLSQLGPWGEFAYKVSQDNWCFWASNPKQDKCLRKLYGLPGMKFMEATKLIDGKNPDGTFNTNWDDLVQDGSLSIPSDSAGNPSDHVMDMLISHKLIDRKLVSYWTSREFNRGEVIFGGLDSSRYNPKTLKYYSVDEKASAADNNLCFWAVDLDKILVGDAQVKLPSKNVTFVLDTGSSRFKGDPKIISEIINLITSNGEKPQKVTKASDLDNYPDLTIVLVDQDGNPNNYTLTAHEYFQEFPDGWRLAFHGLQATKDSSTADELLAGSMFIDHYYTVYDYTTDPVRVGIAERIDPDEPR